MIYCNRVSLSIILSSLVLQLVYRTSSGSRSHYTITSFSRQSSLTKIFGIARSGELESSINEREINEETILSNETNKLDEEVEVCIEVSNSNNTSSSASSNKLLTSGGGAAGFISYEGKSSLSSATAMEKATAPTIPPPMGRVRTRLTMTTTSEPPSKNKEISSPTSLNLSEEIEQITRSFRSIQKMGGPLKVLFLSSDTGGGHRASAEALAKHFQMYYPGTTYDLLDVWSLDGCYPYRTLVKAYKHLSAHPRQWKFLYHFSNTSPYMFVMNLHSWLTCCGKIKRRIEGYDPDVIVSVHPTMNNVPLMATQALRRKHNKNIPFFTVVTDFGSGHATWFRNNVDKIFVPSDRIKKLARRRGRIPLDDMAQSGLPIRHDFAVQAQALGVDRFTPEALEYQRSIREQLGIKDVNKRVVLVMGGGEGVGSLSKIVDALYTTFTMQGIDATVLVICGRNEKLKTKLEERDWDNVLEKNTRLKRRRHLNKLRWAVPSKKIRESLARAANNAKASNDGKKGNVDVVGLGFVTNMAEYMTASDILVSKAGPGTLAEAAALGLPVMITSFLPGQEAGNVNIVLDSGFGDYCSEPFGIAEEVACWIQDEELLRIMSSKAMKIGVPDAASDIVVQIGQMTHESMEVNQNSSN